MRSRMTKYEVKAKRKYSRFRKFSIFQKFLQYFFIGANDDCWEWTGSLSKSGYGYFNWEDEGVQLAHRCAYRLFIGHIPKKLNVCHSCDNPRCVNPNHLWLGTQKENIEDMICKNRRFNTAGENNGNSRLTLEIVDEIRDLYNSGYYTQKELSKKFKLDRSYVGYIVRGDNWVIQ